MNNEKNMKSFLKNYLSMKIKYLFLFLLIPFFAQAQKKKLSIEQAVIGLYTDLRVKNLSQLQFCGSSDNYSYSRKKDGKQVLLQANPQDHNATTFMTIEQLNDLLKKQDIKEVKRFPRIHWVDENSYYFHKNDNTFYVNKKDAKFSINKLWSLPKGSKITAEDLYKPQLAFVTNHNLKIATPDKILNITNDGNEDIVYGQAVHRNEFGINNGSFWSPKSNYLAFYRMDQSMVNDYPIIDWSFTPAKSKNIKYPMAGGTSHEVTLGVYDIKNKATQYINVTGPKDQYLTSVSWSPDEKFIYIGVLNRDQNHLDFNKYDVTTGQLVETIFTDKSDKYVEPQHTLWFYDDTPGKFIWLSQRDGFMHMYLYENDKLKKQLTQGAWIVNDILGYNKKLDEVVFSATKDGAMQKNVYAVKISNRDVRKLNSNDGWHYPQLSKSGSYLIDRYKGKTTPNNIDIIDVENTKKQKRILTAKNTLSDYNIARVSLVKVPIENNIVLYGKLIYPANFDSTKKYPAIVYTYNGPHVQLVKDGFPYSGNLWYDYMASKGYFIFVLDGRGSSNRGFDFESATFRKMGEVEMRDQLKGVEFLNSLPFIDNKRLGVHGWSYGGYMTTSLMTKYPDVFKVGVAGGPVMDWAMYEVMYTERYMDTPETNEENYEKTRLWDKSKDLKNKLLIIHGAQDDVVVWQHSMKFIRDAVKNGKQVDYYVYPAHPHNVRGKDRVHLMQKISDYFDMHLK